MTMIRTLRASFFGLLALGLVSACTPGTYTPLTPEQLARQQEQERIETEFWCNTWYDQYVDAKTSGGGSFWGGYFIGSYEYRCRGVTIR